MIWKTLFIATLAIGALAQLQVTDEEKNKLKSVIKEYCKKNGAEDKADEVEASLYTFVDCLKELFDIPTLKTEIEEAKPKGALDEVFKKYCAKSPQFKTCSRALTVGVTPCMDVNLRPRTGDADTAIDQLVDFVCYKDGDRIALFIAEEGPKCLQEKVTKLRDCMTKVTEGINNVEDAKNLSLNEKCGKYDEVTSCIVTALEECSSPTPGNMADSLFRYLRNSTPCKKN